MRMPVPDFIVETGIQSVATRLAWVHVTRPVVHVNGDHAQYLDHVFRMDWVGGQPFPADDESDAAQWFDLSDMPPISDGMRRRIEMASDESTTAATLFDTVSTDVPSQTVVETLPCTWLTQ
jgi:hypothetical protein